MRLVSSNDVKLILNEFYSSLYKPNLSEEECAQILHTTEWDIHKAIKCVVSVGRINDVFRYTTSIYFIYFQRLRQQLRSHNIDVDCNWAEMLNKFNWNIRQAFNYLLATRGVPEDTTEV